MEILKYYVMKGLSEAPYKRFAQYIYVLLSVSPDVSLYYITNSPDNDIALFDHNKPTILLLHPVALDSSWLRTQFKDSRLTNSYNLIAFDQRNAGRTRSPYSAHRDSYVDAADLAFALELLQLPPVHIFAVQVNSVWAAIRLAVLFPSKVLSQCLLSIPADVPLHWAPTAFADLIEIWCFPPDLETFEQACLEMSYFQFSGQVSSDLEDEIVAWWQVNMPPRRRRAVMEITVGRCPPTKEEYARIRVPTLLMTGDKSSAHPVEEAIKTHEAISDSTFFVVKGAPEMFVFLPQYTSVTHRVCCEFLNRQPTPPKFVPGTPDVEKMARRALTLLAEMSGDPSIASRSPTNPLSFCMWSPEVLAQHQAILDQMEVGEDQAFSPLDAHGCPVRKFSSRHDDQWTSTGFDLLLRSGKAIRDIRVKSAS